jgi:signal peptidase I
MKIAAAKCSGLRRIVEYGVYFLLAAGFVDLWLLQGLVIPRRVAGPSMATTLLGVHQEVVCADCGFRFSCGADGHGRPRAVCPNCGYADNDLGSLTEINGDRLLFNQAAFALRAPRRWEVVALRSPRNAEQVVVKRVVGLPGETIELCDGDVYVNGEIARKDLPQQREVAILVHDADYCPKLKPIPPPRWQTEGPEGRWRSAGGHFSHTTSAADEPVAWLVYHHWRRVGQAQRDPPHGTNGDGGSHGARPTLPPSGSSSVIESPVTDICGYNPGPRREEDVHAVADLMLSFRLACGAGRGTVCVRATDGFEDFEARLRFDGGLRGCEVFSGGEIERQGDKETRRQGERQTISTPCLPVSLSPCLLVVSLVDQQFLLALDDRTVVRWPYRRPASPAGLPTGKPFAIGAQGIDAQIEQLRVYRDVYYTRPLGLPGPSAAGTVKLGKQQYFLLGDNSPVSDDSRSWPNRGAVDGKLLLAKPLLAIPSIPAGWFGHGRFQVPNFRGIRYIP